MKLPTPPDGFGVSTAMGLVWFAIWSNLTCTLGQIYLGDSTFEPVWAELNKHNAVVFIHPADTVMPPNLTFGPCMYLRGCNDLNPLLICSLVVQEFPFDTCRSIASVIHSGVLHRHPNVHFLFSHNGGAFPFVADRIGTQHHDDVIMKVNGGKDLREVLKKSNIYFDTAISRPYQYSVVKELGLPTEHLIYATDFPYTKRHDSAAYLDGYDGPKKSGLFNDAEMQDICRNNALKLFPRLQKEFARLI